MSKSELKSGESASGAAANISGAIPGTSDDDYSPSETDRIALDLYIREVKYKARKFLLEGGPLDEAELRDNEHLAGMKNDFADLLNIPTDCNFFRSKSEKNWDYEATNSTFSCQKFFNLNLELLSQGLESLPFYEKIMLQRGIFSESDIQKCEIKAAEASEKYKKMRENFEKEAAEEMKFSKSFEDLTGIKWEPREPKTEPEKVVEEPVKEEVDIDAPHHGKYWLSHRTELKEKGDDSYLAPSSSDESLEIWLDTVLDD